MSSCLVFPPPPGRREELQQRFQLDPTKKCRTYSKGNRPKVALVAALASEAELLILDEPTSGLDPLMTAAPATLEELFMRHYTGEPQQEEVIYEPT